VANLKNTKADMEEEKAEGDLCCGDEPLYPYGTAIYLDDETLKKIGLTTLPKFGTIMPGQVVMKVTGTSQRAYMDKDGKEEMRTCVDIQITDLELAPPTKTAAETLYPSKE